MIKHIRSLILIPAIGPFIGLLFVSSLNLSKPLQLTILTWRTPSLPIGIWMVISSSSAALITGTFAASLNSENYSLRRKFVRNLHNQDNDLTEEYIEDQLIDENYIKDYPEETPTPERSLQDPFPTISVPYRVIKRTTNSDQYEDTQITYSTNGPSNKDDQVYQEEIQSTDNQDWVHINFENW